MSSVDLPSIQTNFPSYLPSRSYRSSPSPSSPSPVMTFQNRSLSNSSISSRLSSSSLHSQYSSASDRSLSCSPGPSTPCDMMSRSPSFSQDRPHKPIQPLLQKHHAPLSTYPPLHHHHHQSRYSDHPHPHSAYSPSVSAPQHFQHPPSPHHHHAAHHAHHAHHSGSIPHSRQYHGGALPRDAYHHRGSRDEHPEGRERSPYGSSSSHSEYFHPRSAAAASGPYHPLPTPTTPSAHTSEAPRPRSLSPGPRGHMSPSDHSTPYGSPRRGVHSRHPTLTHETYSRSTSRSPSVSSDRSVFSPEASPFGSDQEEHEQDLGCRRSSPSMSSLSASLSNGSSLSMSSMDSSMSSPGGSSPPSGGMMAPQLLLCPVCRRAFKPSKNQNCNLRRHLKNVHNMSPAMHPRKCKWDSLPDGRVKDDKDRKERTRKSKRLWARKFRLRRKVEEAAVVLSMLSQAV